MGGGHPASLAGLATELVEWVGAGLPEGGVLLGELGAVDRGLAAAELAWLGAVGDGMDVVEAGAPRVLGALRRAVVGGRDEVEAAERLGLEGAPGADVEKGPEPVLDVAVARAALAAPRVRGLDKAEAWAAKG